MKLSLLKMLKLHIFGNFLIQMMLNISSELSTAIYVISLLSKRHKQWAIHFRLQNFFLNWTQ